MKHVVCLALALSALACRAHRSHKDEPPPAAATAVIHADEKCPAHGVVTASGCVRGANGAFLGIPYAAPPVGPLRWKLPQPPAAWRGVRDAFAFGSACPQLPSKLTGPLATDEDCLTLNVWSPDVAPAAKLPVMVWIHGGGFVQGASALPLYNGAHLAHDGGVVVVSLNYRLGPLGFLAHPALSAEDSAHHVSGNLGLHDQIAALAWVRANIAAFGGDPSNVTIFGESAGGESVCALLASPLASGLYARGVIESAQCVAIGKAARVLRGGDASAEAQGERIAHTLGCDGANAPACLRGKSADAILHASPAAFGFLGKGEHYGLAVDGWALPDAPAALQAAGKLADVPMIVGTTADEGTLFTTVLRVKRPIGLLAILNKIFPGSARTVAQQYATFGSPQAAFDAFVTDFVFTCPARTLARQLHARQPHVYRYLFSHATEHARAQGLGATHGSEIAFVFGTQDAPTADERALSAAMLGYWTSFAKTGDPNHAGAPVWPAYDATADRYLELGTPIAAHDGLRTAACNLLDSLTVAQREPDED